MPHLYSKTMWRGGNSYSDLLLAAPQLVYPSGVRVGSAWFGKIAALESLISPVMAVDIEQFSKASLGEMTEWSLKMGRVIVTVMENDITYTENIM